MRAADPLAELGQLRYPEWHDRAACRGEDSALFFPPRGAPTADAKAVCAGCPVRVDCLDDALAHGIRFGVWGGQSAQERRRLRRERRAA